MTKMPPYVEVMRIYRTLSGVGAGALVTGSASALLLGLAATPAAATTTFTVDTLADDSTAVHVTDCTTPVVGACSLREALAAATSGDTIVFAASLTSGGPATIELDGHRLVSTAAVTITGPGSGLLTIAQSLVTPSPVLVIDTTGVADVVMSGVTLTHGRTAEVQPGTFQVDGVGFTVSSHGDVILRDVVATDNRASWAGGAFAFYNTGEVTIEDSIVTGNRASGIAGGIYVYSPSMFTMKNSTVSSNTAPAVGGILTMDNTSHVEITSSTFEANTAPTAYSTWETAGALMMRADHGVFDVVDSTFVANENSLGGGAAIVVGGLNRSGDLTLANSTLTQNVSHITSAPMFGGVVRAWPGSYLYLLQDTIVDNSVVATTGIPDANSGAVVFASSAGGMTIAGTILTGNHGSASSADLALYGGSASIAIDHSILGVVTPVAAVSGVGNLVHVAPLLGPLALNGGPTRTMALLSGSPALDAGGAVVPSFVLNEFDQRGTGHPRIVNGFLDIGAFELAGGTSPTTTISDSLVVPTFTG